MAAIVAVPLLYFVAALILGLIPANVSFRQAPQGIPIYVRSNGVHTDIVMPKVTPEMDWRPYADPTHLRDPRWRAADHVAIGYGSRDFYLNVPTWGDLGPGNVAGALFGGGPTLLHVEHVDRPRQEQWQRRIRITPAQYRRLVEFIRPRFRRDARGRPIPVLGRGYGPNDMFYEAEGGFNFVLNCNEWTGRALRTAGVRIGLWTPFEQSVMWRLD